MSTINLKIKSKLARIGIVRILDIFKSIIKNERIIKSASGAVNLFAAETIFFELLFVKNKKIIKYIISIVIKTKIIGKMKFKLIMFEFNCPR